MLRAYRAANMRRLTAEQALESAFHIGQAYAFADRGAEALQSFRDADADTAPEEWRAFVAAHVAFFSHDRAALARARARYAAAAHADAMRLGFIEGMLKCPDKSYMEAVSCAS